jgi:hypothetical protein
MWKHLLKLGSTIAFLTLAVTVSAHCPRIVQGEQRFPPVEPISISLPHFALGPNERVVSFQCEATPPGGFLQFNTPYEWDISISNGVGNAAKLTANAVEGQDEFANKDLGYFNDFVVIGRPRKLPDNYAPFDITVELTISMDPQMDKTRTEKFSMKQLIIKPLQ